MTDVRASVQHIVLTCVAALRSTPSFATPSFAMQGFTLLLRMKVFPSFKSPLTFILRSGRRPRREGRQRKRTTACAKGVLNPDLKQAPKQTGVTLIEVLTALALLAGVVASVTGLISQNARFMADAQDRLLASIVAENVMVEEFANARTPRLGANEEKIEIGGRQFVYRRAARRANAGLVQIDLEVRRNGEERVLARLSAVRRGR